MRLVKYRDAYAAEWWEDGKRFRRSLGTRDPLNAQVAFAQFNKIREELNRKPYTVKQAWEGYRASLGDKPAAKTMGFEWKAVGPHFGEKLAYLITEEDCLSYTALRRAKGRSDGTIWTELGRVRMALLWAKKKNHIDVVPEITRPSPPPPRKQYMTREDVALFYKACQFPHLLLWARLAIGTAGRAQALLDLTWDRVDFRTNLIDLHDPDRSVTRKGRATVPMNKGLRKALEEARKGATCDYVIEWGGQKVGSVKKGVHAAAVRAGMPWVTPHVFRKTAARLMAEAGRPMSEIAQYLGHGDETTTARVYARYSPTYLSGAADALDIE